MALSGKKKHDYSTEEIAILECVIDYADRMIYEDKTLDPLGGLADSRDIFQALLLQCTNSCDETRMPRPYSLKPS